MMPSIGRVISWLLVVRTIVQLTEEQAAELKRLAREHHKSVAAIMREAVDGLLAKGRDRHDGEVRRAMSAAGAGRSGLGGLAEEHDAYLAERPGGESGP